MTRNVMLAIRGMQFSPEVNGEAMETVSWGQYYEKENARYLIYDEYMEGFEEPVKNTIRIKPGEVSLLRKGLINVNMVFEEDKRTVSNYRTPFGEIRIGIETGKISMEETDDALDIEIAYGLELNYEFLSDCSISIHLTPVGGAKE